jgi:hypothetical protein
MKGNYFTVELHPDIIDGDVSKFIADDKTDTPFGANDLLFDWQAVDVPNGSIGLTNVMVHMVGEDGDVQADRDLYFYFAKSIDGTAPSTLGEENAVQTAGFELPRHLIGAYKLEATAATMKGLAFGQVYISGASGNAGIIPGTTILTPEVNSGTYKGYGKLYVACFTGGALDFSTGVLSTGVISADAQTTIAVDTVDARKAFQPGDKVYVHDVDTLCGTVSSVAEGVITLEANNAVAVANNDEIINGSPVRVTLGFAN